MEIPIRNNEAKVNSAVVMYAFCAEGEVRVEATKRTGVKTLDCMDG